MKSMLRCVWTEKRQSEGQGEKGKRGAFVALSGACDVSKGVPQPELC